MEAVMNDGRNGNDYDCIILCLRNECQMQSIKYSPTLPFLLLLLDHVVLVLRMLTKAQKLHPKIISEEPLAIVQRNDM